MSQPSAFEQVCFVAFFATLPLYSPNMIFSPDLAGFDLAMPYFVHSTLASAMVAGMAAACIALCAKEPSRITFLTPLRMTIVALLYLTGLFLLFASLLLPGVPVELCSLLGGTLCGTTTLLLCIAWGSVFSTLTFREALIRLSVLLAICALINTGFVYMGPETGVASFLLLSILGLVPLLIRSTHGEFVRLLNVQRDAKSQDSTVFHSFFSVALGPFVGFLLFALTMAVRKIAVFGNMYAESIGTILAVVSVLPLWLRKSDKPLLPFVFQIYLPIFAAILLFLSSFPTGHAVHSIGMIGIYVFFGAIGVLALASFCAIAHAQEFSVPLIFGSSISAFCLVSIIGLHFGDLAGISGNEEAVLLALSTLYFISLVLVPNIRSWKTMYLPSQQANKPNLLSDLETCCNRVADKGGPSKREREVLLFLGRGYSPAYVAKKMFLSDSTVRSHIKSIYKKLDIHSREDLLQLIENENEPSSMTDF